MLTPMKTKARARPRRAGSTSATVSPDISAVTIAPVPISARPASRVPSDPAVALSTPPAVNSAMPASSPWPNTSLP
jgi:hypothetical protein